MFSSNVALTIRKVYRQYQQHSGILLPLIVLNTVLIFVDRIPYLNLIGTTVSTVALIFTVLCISLLYGRLKVFISLLLLLVLVWILSVFIRLSSYQEALGSTIYVLCVGISCWFLFRERFSSEEAPSHIESQRALFNKEFSEISNSAPAAWQKSYIDRIQTHLLTEKKKNQHVVELGCGDGKLSISLARMGYDVTACDISDTSIALVKKFSRKAKVRVATVQCDVTKLPFQNGSFDYAIAGAILEHLEDEETALEEWSRVLKKGGRIMIVTPLRQRHVLPIWWVLNWFHDRRLGHVRRYDKKRYESLSRFGLHLDSVIYTGHTPKVLLTIANMLLRNQKIEELAERADNNFESYEYDGNNITGFFTKV